MKSNREQAKSKQEPRAGHLIVANRYDLRIISLCSFLITTCLHCNAKPNDHFNIGLGSENVLISSQWHLCFPFWPDMSYYSMLSFSAL